MHENNTRSSTTDAHTLFEIEPRIRLDYKIVDKDIRIRHHVDAVNYNHYRFFALRSADSQNTHT